MPWSLGGQGFYESVIKAVADRYEIDLHTPWRELDREQQDRFLHGTGGDRILVTYKNRMGRKRQYTMAFEGLVHEPPAPLPRDRLEPAARADRGVHVDAAVPRVPRRAAQAGGARGHRRGEVDLRVLAAVGDGGAPLRRRTRADADRGAHRPPDPEGDPRAAHVPRRRRRRLPQPRPRGPHALRRRGAAAPPRDADRLAARRRPLHPRRAVDRPSPARQRPPDRHAGAAPRPRQHRARRRARRADDARGRLARRHGAGRRRARRRGRRGGHGRGRDAQPALGHRRLPLGQARDRRARAPYGGRRLVPRSSAHASTTSRTSTSSSRSRSSSA